MLRQVLEAIEETDGAVSVQTLSRRLALDPGVVAGLVEFWVRKGRLRVVADPLPLAGCPGSGCGGGCGGDCAQAGGCPLAALTPPALVRRV